ncbi:ABC transporter permease [Megasphaera elsdenii]|uniref:Transport permease protein n=1 Tax=Megasphaera elsdenii TaxID=907 RepID=A0A848ESG9_MEGEL|nr:ABC transporter permease [Megasphaera elsdenii]NMK39096.1 ABC transporter permease [Megasphaera elsdenii]
MSITNSWKRFKKNQFLFEELVKRDFKQKYKRTILGMGWSVLSPLLTLLVLKLVFGFYFGRHIEHYTIYLFCGNLLFSYFKESTTTGMNSLMSNASIFSKINVPKYLFLFSKNISTLINFGLTMIIFFIFVFLDDISYGPHFLMLVFPVFCLILFNLGMGLILSALFVFFRDISYLYSIFTMLLMYMSAIFYDINIVPERFRFLFYFNPIYCYIEYFRNIVIQAEIPSLLYHALCLGYGILAFSIGCLIYKKKNHKFLYYI